MSDIQAEVTRLAAVEEIKQLKAQYAAYCDDNYDPDGISSLFVEDGVWDGGPEFGRYEGPGAIHAFFSEVSEKLVFAAHLSLNPIITVDGDRAHGAWRLFCPCTLKGDDGVPTATWILANYEEDYVRRDGRWLFQTLQVEANYIASHEEGWAEQTA